MRRPKIGTSHSAGDSTRYIHNINNVQLQLARRVFVQNGKRTPIDQHPPAKTVLNLVVFSGK